MRGRGSRDSVGRDVGTPWGVAGRGRVCPTGFRRRVARRWRRVGVIFERVIEEAARRRKGIRVRKQKDSTEEQKREEQEGLAEKSAETLNEEKRKQSRENIPQRMLQTGNG